MNKKEVLTAKADWLRAQNAIDGRAELSAVLDARKTELTNTELNWRVENNSYGLELLNMKQRHEIHNLKTAGYILNNVTPSGVALLTIHGANGYTNASVNKAGSVSHVHFNRNEKENS